MNELKSNLEDISNEILETKNLSTLLSEHFFCLENYNAKEDNDSRKDIVLSEWWNLKHNFDEYRVLLINIIKKLDKEKEDLDAIISALYQKEANQ